MIAGLKPYPAMKESGVAWLGDVPGHWQVRRLGQIGNFSKGRGGNKDDELPTGIPCVRYGDLYTTHEHFIEQSRSFVSIEKAGEYTQIKYGDVLFETIGLGRDNRQEIGKSAVNLIDSEARCGGVRANSVPSDYTIGSPWKLAVPRICDRLPAGGDPEGDYAVEIKQHYW